MCFVVQMSGERFLQPSAEDVESDFWRSFDPDQMVTGRIFKQGGLHSDSEDDSDGEDDTESEPSSELRHRETKTKKLHDRQHDIPQASAAVTTDVPHRPLHPPPIHPSVDQVIMFCHCYF